MNKKIRQSYSTGVITINLICLYYSDLIHNFLKIKLYYSCCSDMVLSSLLKIQNYIIFMPEKNLNPLK